MISPAAPLPLPDVPAERGTDTHDATAHDAARLRAALLRLPEQERTVLALFYHENLTIGEIAAVLDWTEPLVSWTYSSALAALREALGEAALHAPPRLAA